MKKLFVLLLCFCIGAVAFAYPKSPKIYDTFLFFNELEVLDIRLHEMADHVDKFVIVEACETFRGKPKPYCFQENQHRFEKFKDKIIYIQIDETYKTDNPWVRERWQRNQIIRGLKNAKPQDIIIHSDLDEIVRGSRIPEIVNILSSKIADAVICRQTMYQGFLNRYQTVWNGTVCTSYKKLQQSAFKWIRRVRDQKPRILKKAQIKKPYVMNDAGWHFTSMGGLDRFITKIESVSHYELDTPEFKNKANLARLIQTFPKVGIDETYPQFVRDNQERLLEIGFIER